MADEIKSLFSNNVVEVVEKPVIRKVISFRWVYALKKNSSGYVIRHKARLVAKGYSQVQGVDYGEVFAPVVRWVTIRFLLAQVAKTNMELKQVEVKTAFLYGTLDENINMELPILTKDVIHESMNQYGRNHNMFKSLC